MPDLTAIQDHAIDVIVGLIITGLLGLLALGLKSWLREEITKATYPLQPHANGGLSLPDVAKTATETKQDVKEMLGRQIEIHGDVQKLVGIVQTHLQNHA